MKPMKKKMFSEKKHQIFVCSSHCYSFIVQNMNESSNYAVPLSRLANGFQDNFFLIKENHLIAVPIPKGFL